MKDYIKCPEIINNARNDNSESVYLIVEMLISIAAYLVIQKTMEFIGPSVREFVSRMKKSKINDTDGYLIYCALYLAQVLLVMAFIMYVRRRSLKSVGFGILDAPKNIGLGAAFGIAFFAFAFFVCKVSEVITLKENSKKTDFTVYLIIIIMNILLAMVQELFFRGYLLTVLAKKNSLVIAIMLSSIFYAAVHVENINKSRWAFVNLVLFGMFTSLLFLKSESVWMSCAFYALWNVTQENFFGVSVNGGKVRVSYMTASFKKNTDFMTGGDFGMNGGLAVTIALGLGIIIMLFSMLDKE